MKTYTSKATAKRGAIRELSKGRGLTQDEVKAQFDDLATIEQKDSGEWFWRAIQHEVNPRCAKPESMKASENDDLADDNIREMAYTETGDAIPASEAPKMITGVNLSDDNEVAYTTAANETKTKRTIEFKVKSEVERPTKLVWDIADSMPGARRKDVIAACVEQGVAFNTARTQFQLWFTAVKNSSPASE